MPADAAATGRALVTRLIDEVINQGHLEVLDEIYTHGMAAAARRWIVPFREAFPDVHMEIVHLVADERAIAGRFRCSATHLGRWRGQDPTGRRFERVDEVYFFDVADGRIAGAWGLEDTPSRLRQLGLER